MRDAGRRTSDIGHRTAEKAKIIYPPPRGVDIIKLFTILFGMESLIRSAETCYAKTI